MARDRTLPIDFWTWEAVIDCTPMTRLLFLGLWNFADAFGVQPLRPRTIRLQVFPGDELSNDAVRAMVDELAERQLLRLYTAEGQEYIEILDWEQIQGVGKRAKRRYPAFPSSREGQEPTTNPDPSAKKDDDSGRRGAMGADIDGVERLARGHEQPVPPGFDEAGSAAHLGQADATRQFVMGGAHDSAVAEIAAASLEHQRSPSMCVGPVRT